MIVGSGLRPEDLSLYCQTSESTNLDVLFNLHCFIAFRNLMFSMKGERGSSIGHTGMLKEESETSHRVKDKDSSYF